MTTASLEHVAKGFCTACGNQRWIAQGDDPDPAPCGTCKPYGGRTPTVAAMAKGARVRFLHTGRTGRVLRAFRDGAGRSRPPLYTMYDVAWDDGHFGIAWEGDLEAAA